MAMLSLVFPLTMKALRGANDVTWPWNSVWCTKAPKRVAFFV